MEKLRTHLCGNLTLLLERGWGKIHYTHLNLIIAFQDMVRQLNSDQRYAWRLKIEMNKNILYFYISSLWIILIACQSMDYFRTLESPEGWKTSLISQCVCTMRFNPIGLIESMGYWCFLASTGIGHIIMLDELFQSLAHEHSLNSLDNKYMGIEFQYCVQPEYHINQVNRLTQQNVAIMLN